MKKLLLISGLLLLGVSMTVSSCRKPPPMDPCENVICDEGYTCVNGKCVEMRRK